jgi:chromosome segregation ATPase
VDALKAELDAARKQARKLVGEAQVNATQHADEIAARLERVQKIQQEQTQNVIAVSDKVSQVKSDADATKTQVSEVTNDLGSVKTELTTTKSELEKTIGDMKRTMGELGVQSGLIATNTKELAALRALGERNYIDFVLRKEKVLRKVGDIHIQLKSADPNRNRYSLDVMIDDKVTEKKDKTVNEPIQIVRAGFTQPYELIVNEVKKDMISGYLAAPKTPQTRN